MAYLVISSKFQWIPSQIVYFQNFRYNSIAINNEQKSYNKRYLPLSSSKYNETSPKLVYFSRDQRYSDACKNSTDFDAKCKGYESKQVAHR